MADDPPLGVQHVPDVLGEAEVRGVVAVQVADLAPAEPERELAARALPRRSRPGQDVDRVDDLRLAEVGEGHAAMVLRARVAVSRGNWS